MQRDSLTGVFAPMVTPFGTDDAVLLSGALPLDVLDERIDAWIAREKAAPVKPVGPAPKS